MRVNREQPLIPPIERPQGCPHGRGEGENREADRHQTREVASRFQQALAERSSLCGDLGAFKVDEMSDLGRYLSTTGLRELASYPLRFPGGYNSIERSRAIAVFPEREHATHFLIQCGGGLGFPLKESTETGRVRWEESTGRMLSELSEPYREAYRLAQLRCLVHETDERLRREGRDPDALSDEVWTTLYNFPTVEDAKATLNDTRSEPATRLEAQRRVALG